MRDNLIVNAAPMVISLGTQDLSIKKLPKDQVSVPQHLPKLYLFAQKGPKTPQLVVGVDRENIFGADTFNYRKKYSNHATVFANELNAQGNICMLQRVIPEDAGPEANFCVWLDVLRCDKIPRYERNSDGSYQLGADNKPVASGEEINGFKVKFVITSHDTVAALNHPDTGFGKKIQKTGSLTGVGPDCATSTMYPFFEFQVSSVGEDGNNSGIRIWAPTESDTIMPTAMMSKEKAYPFIFQIIKRLEKVSTPDVVETVFNEPYTTVVMKRDVIDPLTDKSLYVGDTLLSAYQNINDPRYAPVFGDFSKLAIYQNNIDDLLDEFHEAEAEYIPDLNAATLPNPAYMTDFTADPKDKYLFNFVSGVSSYGIPYETYIFASDATSVNLSEFTNIFASGGSDGTINDTVFDNLVEVEMAKYANSNEDVQDLAYHVESIFYDSGFNPDTKYNLIKFISKRPDTSIILSTYTACGPSLTLSEEYSLAIALRTRLEMYPESYYFGTPVLRGMIVGGSGKVRNSQYLPKVPITLEVAIKAARYMGAANGKWKNGFNFDSAPGSIVDNLYDLSMSWIPGSVRNRLWDVGLNWVQRYNHRGDHFFPALKTAYSEDGSVLNSMLTMLAICELNKVAHAAHREFTGNSTLSPAQFTDRVNAFVNSRIHDRFDGNFVIVPEAHFTEMDQLRSYSWTLPITIYSSNMRTVMTTYIVARNIDTLGT